MENINRENAFKQKKTKPGLKFNPGLSLIGHRTTGPWQLVTMATHMLFLPGIRADRSSKISARTFWVSFKVVSNTESILPLERRIFDPCRPARPPWCNCPKPYELLNCKGDSISAKLHPPPPHPSWLCNFLLRHYVLDRMLPHPPSPVTFLTARKRSNVSRNRKPLIASG